MRGVGIRTYDHRHIGTLTDHLCDGTHQCLQLSVDNLFLADEVTSLRIDNDLQRFGFRRSGFGTGLR